MRDRENEKKIGCEWHFWSEAYLISPADWTLSKLIGLEK